MKQIPREVLLHFSETQCSITYEQPIHVIRKQKKRLKLELESPLSFEALQEMHFLYDSENLAALARLYYCDINEVKKARYRLRKGPAYTTPQALELVPWLSTGLDVWTIANTLGCSVRYINRQIRSAPELVLFKPKHLTEEEKLALIVALKEGKATQAELAEEFGVSQSRVSQLNTDKKPRAAYNRLKPEQWLEIEKALLGKTKSPTQLSREYKVGRSAIYQHMYNRSEDNDLHCIKD